VCVCVSRCERPGRLDPSTGHRQRPPYLLAHSWGPTPNPGRRTALRVFRCQGSFDAASCGAHHPSPPPRLPAPSTPQSLLSYVFTNPPPDTLLNAHDLVYVLRAGSSGADDDADM
jgi:hypothetical protein